MFHMSGVRCHFLFLRKKKDNVVELVVWGSVISRATPSSSHRNAYIFVCDILVIFLQLKKKYGHHTLKPVGVFRTNSGKLLNNKKSFNSSHFSCSEPISWEASGIWLGLHFSGNQIRSTIIFPKIFWMMEQFEKLPILINFWKKSMLIPSVRYLFKKKLHIIHQKNLKGRHPAIGKRCYKHSFKS